MLPNYRDNLGAALARLDALEPRKPTAVLPEKDTLFQRIQESFISQPERWRRERIGWSYTDSRGFGGWADRDGWVRDSPEQDEESIGFYRTGFFWIRIGEVRRRSGDRLERINTDVWVYVFCPRFRRMVRKYRNWRLLKDLEDK